MRRRLRRFVLVGVVVTAVHLALLAWLVDLGWAVPAAATVAVLVAVVISFVAHRLVTFSDDPYALIDHRPGVFAAAVLPAALADVAVVSLLTWPIDDPSVSVVLLAELPALAVGAAIRLVTYRRVLFAAVREGQIRPADRPALVGGPRFSVVIPVFRAPEQIASSLATLRRELEPIVGPGELELVVVDDGSGDDSAETARRAGADRVLVQPVNQGKGAAVRRGMLAATGRAVAFTDADLAYPPDQLLRLLTEVEAGWDVVVGNRRHPEAVLHSGPPRIREVGSLVFNLVTHLVLLGQYRDTQSGLKAFRRDVARVVFSRTQVDGFAFDVEVLHLVERDGLSLREVPAVLADGEESTISVLPVALRMVRDVLSIRSRASHGEYDLGRPVADALAAAAPVEVAGGYGPST